MVGLVGQSFGRYHIVEQLGEGGMATVYKAFDTHLERAVAIKVIRTDMILPSMLDNMLKRFEQEARVLAQFNHPNIVNVFDYGKHNEAPYLVMEYLPGGTLKEYAGSPMPSTEAAKVLLPVARALEYAHELKVIHRDVKPANILISALGEVKLSDFGIAKVLATEENTQLTATGVGIGTPEYMAPEQCVGEVSKQTDQYALGVIFYELVTGRKPYLADTPIAVLLKQMNEPLPRPRQFAPDLPEAVEQVLFKALAKRPQDRYPEMGAFAHALETLAAEVDGTPGDFVVETEHPTLVGEKARPQNQEIQSEAAPRGHLAIPWKPILIGIGGSLFIGLAALFVFLALQIFGSLRTTSVIASPTVQAIVEPEKVAAVAPETPTPTAPPAATPTIILTPTETPIPTLGAGSTQVSPVDGMVMVLVPAGEFVMGAAEVDRQAQSVEKPQHTVYLDDFWIDQTEVTNEMFGRFVEATGYRTSAETDGGWIWNGREWEKNASANWQRPRGPDSTILAKDGHPVVQVTWDEAAAYCAWAGRRLPTEAEWEKAARGEDGRIYPWGDQNASLEFLNYSDLIGDTATVGSYPQGASPYGALDMAGNTWEWVSDWYDPTYYASSPPTNPLGPSSGKDRGMRGGSWHYDETLARSTNRGHIYPSFAGDGLGFRCAVSP